MPEDTLLQDVYGKAKPEQLSLCRLHMRRIKEELIAWAQEGDILPETMGKDEKDALGLLLFEHEVKGRDHSWRLLPSCEVDVFPRLEPLYQEFVAGHTPRIDLFQAYQAYAALVEEYGNGFLADHQPQFRTWRWAKPFYLTYQRRVLQLLEAAVTREQEALASQSPTSKQRMETLGRLAHLHCWYALAAIGLLPQQPQAEQALQQALYLFLHCHDLTGAEDLYQDFAQAWENRGEIWKPQEDAANLWAQVVAQQQAAMNRKSKKAAHVREQKTNPRTP